MLIKELEDVLELIKDMPSDWQHKCVRLLCWQLENWEQRQSEPELSDEDWQELQAERRKLKTDALERALANLEEALSSRDRIQEFLNAIECSGTIEDYDSGKGYGYIQMENGERALLHVTCLRAGGFKTPPRTGTFVRFEAIRRAHGWQAFRVLALKPPASRR